MISVKHKPLQYLRFFFFSLQEPIFTPLVAIICSLPPRLRMKYLFS